MRSVVTTEEFLGTLSREALYRVAAAYGAGRLVGFGEKKKAVRCLAEHVLRDEYLRKAVSRLNVNERLVLKALIIGAGGRAGMADFQRFVEKRLRLAANGRPLIEGLLARGLVFEDRHSRAVSPAYLVPVDLCSRLLVLVARDILMPPNDEPIYRREGVPATGATPAPRADGSRLLETLDGLVRFLAWVSRKPLRLTRDGRIYKRQAQRLAATLGGAATGRSGSVSVFNPYDYPPPVPLYFFYGLGANLLEDDLEPGERRVTVSPRAREAVFGPREGLWAGLCRYWLDYWYRHDVQAEAILSLLLLAPEDAWVDAGLLSGRVRSLSLRGGDSYGLSIEDVVNLLAALGIAERRAGTQVSRETGADGRIGAGGRTGADRPSFRLTPWGRLLLAGETPLLPAPAEGVITQPNFEVLVPPGLPPAELWGLERMASPVRVDRMSVYRLERQALYRALDVSREGEDDPVRFLAKLSRTGLPQNVEFTLREWMRDYNRLYLMETTLIRCDDPDVAARIRSSPRLGPYILGEITPCDLIIDSGCQAAVLRALEAEGLAPRPSVVRSGQGVHAPRDAHEGIGEAGRESGVLQVLHALGALGAL